MSKLVWSFSLAVLSASSFKETVFTLLPGQNPLLTEEDSKLLLMKPEKGMIFHTEKA